MDRQRFTHTIIHQRTAAAVDFHIFSMHPPFFILIHPHNSRISGVVTHHREGFVIIICNDQPSQFSRFCRLIAVHLQHFRVEVIQVDRIFLILAQLDRDKSVFIISIRANRRKSEDFFRQLIRGIRQCLTHGKYHLYLPLTDISSRPSDITGQCSQRTRIGHQYLDLLFLDIFTDLFQRIISHVGDIHHDQIIFERFPHTYGIFPLYPRAEFPTLHSQTETVQFHTGNKVHIDPVHLVTVTQNGKWRSGRTTGTQPVQITLFFAVLHQHFLIMLKKISLGHHREIFQFCPFRMFFIIRRMVFYIVQKQIDPPLHIFRCHTFHDLSFIDFF